jgi:hypothetical protein
VKYLKAFGQFWYDFIIGDDWKIAVGVVSALAVLYLVMSANVLSDTWLTIVGGVLIVVAFTTSLAIDVRSKRR